MIRKLRRKFVAIVMAASAVILAAVFVVLVLTTQSGIRRQSDEILQMALNGKPRSEKADLPQKDFGRNEDDRNEDDFPDGKTPPELPFPGGRENSRGGDRSLTFTAKVDEDGGVELEDRAAMLLGEYRQAEIETLALAAAAAEEDSGTLPEQNLRYLKRETDDGVLIAFADTSLEENNLTELIKNSLIVGAIALLIVFGASILLARWAVRPVETAWNRQKQFVGDASHELKTPLTVILSNADMILAHPEEDPSRWAGNIQAEGQRMKDLTQQLLSLARSEDGAGSPVMETLDLSDLLTDSALSFEPVAFENGHELFYDDVAPGVTLQGDATGLSQLCGILIDNAVKYAVPGGKIWVSLETGSKHARIRVSNEGEAISREDLDRIFERFYRADPSRHGEGHGLGLAIAKRVTEQHRGKIWAESENGVNSFLVSLPMNRK